MEASNSTIKKKYPYTLLTEDYGILNENDLAAYARGKPLRPFNLENSGAYNYWQCFPREKVTVFLEDMGYSSEDHGWRDTLADLTIKVYPAGPRVIHEYQMRKIWPVADFEKRFRLWHKLMADQEYVCFAGSFGDKSVRMENGVLREIYSWTFEKIKTKKGSDFYFGS